MILIQLVLFVNDCLNTVNRVRLSEQHQASRYGSKMNQHKSALWNLDTWAWHSFTVGYLGLVSLRQKLVSTRRVALFISSRRISIRIVLIFFSLFPVDRFVVVVVVVVSKWDKNRLTDTGYRVDSLLTISIPQQCKAASIFCESFNPFLSLLRVPPMQTTCRLSWRFRRFDCQWLCNYQWTQHQLTCCTPPS